VIFALAVVLERLSSTGWYQRVGRDIIWCRQAIAQLAGWAPWSWSLTRRDLVIDIAAFCLDDLLIQLTCAVAVGFVVAQPLLRLRYPRPPAQQLIRQSGFAACVITMWAVLVVFAIGGSAWYSHVVLSTALVRGVAVFLLWVVLGLPPWRKEPSWIDRLGRAVGSGLILAVATEAVLECVHRV
jgi:hypothetical protein